MTVASRLILWNRWYDNAPPEGRFQFILWPLLALGTLNMLLTLRAGVPFALLVLLGIIFFAAIRVPYNLGWLAPATDAAPDPRFEIVGADWLLDINHRYDAMPDTRRFWVYPAVLLIAGGINMLLTIGSGFPFGLLFLLALLALVCIRAPYTAGWLKPRDAVSGPASYSAAIEHAQPPIIQAPLTPAPSLAEAYDAPVVIEHEAHSSVMEQPHSPTPEEVHAAPVIDGQDAPATDAASASEMATYAPEAEVPHANAEHVPHEAHEPHQPLDESPAAS